jgi:hypothetical protein
VSGACSTHSDIRNSEKVHVLKAKGRDHLGNLYGCILLKQISKKEGARV